MSASTAMDRYADEDDEAFNVVYDQLSSILHDLLRRRVMDRSLAEKLVQETFVRMHRARGQFKRGAGVQPWVIAIALRVWKGHLRRAGRRSCAVDEIVASASVGRVRSCASAAAPPK